MVNVIGLGYIGLPTALMMASHGVEVVGTDYNPQLVATLNAGKVTFQEDGLEELFAQAVACGIRFTTEYQVTDTYIISVPTPYDSFSKKLDPGYIISALEQVLSYIKTKPFGDSNRVALTCNKNNPIARKLYESRGFAATGAEDEDEIELVLTLD